jgi:hypothetical protein
MAAFRKRKAILLKSLPKDSTTPFNFGFQNRFQNSATHCCHLEGKGSTLLLKKPLGTTAKIPWTSLIHTMEVHQICSPNSSDILVLISRSHRICFFFKMWRMSSCHFSMISEKYKRRSKSSSKRSYRYRYPLGWRLLWRQLEAVFYLNTGKQYVTPAAMALSKADKVALNKSLTKNVNKIMHYNARKYKVGPTKSP